MHISDGLRECGPSPVKFKMHNHHVLILRPPHEVFSSFIVLFLSLSNQKIVTSLLFFNSLKRFLILTSQKLLFKLYFFLFRSEFFRDILILLSGIHRYREFWKLLLYLLEFNDIWFGAF